MLSILMSVFRTATIIAALTSDAAPALRPETGHRDPSKLEMAECRIVA